MQATIHDLHFNHSRQLTAKQDPVTDEQLLAVLNAQAAYLELSWHPNDLLACSSRDTFVLPRLAHHAAGFLRMTAG